MPGLPEETLVALLLRFESRIDLIRRRTATNVGAAWSAVTDYTDADAAEFVRRVAPALDAASSAAAQTAHGLFSSMLGITPPPYDLAALRLPDPRGPFLAVWHAFNEGRPLAEAAAAGASRAEALGFDTVQSSARQIGDQLGEGRVRGWRRVPGAGACVWCQTIAGQLYATAETADFGHNRCDCVAVPVLGDKDPGAALNARRAG